MILQYLSASALSLMFELGDGTSSTMSIYLDFQLEFLEVGG